MCRQQCFFVMQAQGVWNCSTIIIHTTPVCALYPEIIRSKIINENNKCLITNYSTTMKNIYPGTHFTESITFTTLAKHSM